MRTLIGSLLLVVLTAIVGVGWTLDQIFERLANDNINDEIQIYQEMGAQIAAILNTASDPRAIMTGDIKTDFLGISLHASKDFQLPPSMRSEFETGEALVLESDDGVSLYYYLPRNGEVLTITPTSHNTSSLPTLKLVFTTVFYIAVLALLLIWLYPLIKRLTKLSAAAKDFGSGQLNRRVCTEGVSYISDIEGEFNRMAGRIQTLISDNKLLSSAVSHDLRTPLARLRFGIDTLEDTGDPQARQKYTQRLSADISEMEKLVSSLLEFARLDHVLLDSATSVLQIENLIAECIELNSQENIATSLNIKGKHLIKGNANYFMMLINNLLQNALKFAVQSVRVELTQLEKGSLLIVSDDGPGIPESQHRNVLMPFTRGDNNSTGKGHGLGLAIVNRIAQQHGGSVEIGVCPDLLGARISVFFPSKD
ncbi:MAG: ATP-binding protein [Granulosicoccus sp.]